MNGVTGRMGTNQHLIRSIDAIRKEGGVLLRNGERLMPEPLLIGRNSTKLKELSERVGGVAWSTDLHNALSDPAFEIYFDSQLTDLRFEGVKSAIAARKAIYCEKPTATTVGPAYELYKLATEAG
jgi:predicted dehydrogenase